MSVSNMQRWTEICDIQHEILTKMSRRFPQRKKQLTSLTSDWDRFKHQVESDNIPNCSSAKLSEPNYHH